MGFGLNLQSLVGGLQKGAALGNQGSATHSQAPSSAPGQPGANGQIAEWRTWIQDAMARARAGGEGGGAVPGQSIYGGNYPNWMGQVPNPQGQGQGGNPYAAQRPMQALQAMQGQGSPNVAQQYSPAPANAVPHPMSYNPYSPRFDPYQGMVMGEDAGGYGVGGGYGAPGLDPRFYSGPAPDFGAAMRQAREWPTRYPSPAAAPWYGRPPNQPIEVPNEWPYTSKRPGGDEQSLPPFLQPGFDMWGGGG
jgi:hypothetical protein